jgi:hypothetical protein
MAIISGIDKKIETWVLDRFDVSRWEQQIFDGVMDADAVEMPGEVIGVEQVSETMTSTHSPSGDGVPLTPSVGEKALPTPELEKVQIIEKKPPPSEEVYPLAPEIMLTDWIGSPPLTME